MDQHSRIDSLLEMLLKEPNDIFLNYALGIEYLASKDFENAELLFKKVLTLEPNYSTAYYQLGKLFEAQARNKEALDYFRDGLEKSKLEKNNKAINEFNEAIFMLDDE